MPRFKWPWTNELEDAKQGVLEAREHRVQAEKQAVAARGLTQSVNRRADLNGFGATYVIRKLGKHA